MKRILAGLVIVAGFVVGSALPASASCSYYSSGRTTCRTYTGGGSYSYSSSNPYSGYSSYGSRYSSGYGSSYGSRTYSSPRSYGYSSYSSSGGYRSYSGYNNRYGSYSGSSLYNYRW